MSDGQEKSPFSDSLATEENGLGIENLNQRLQRYAGAKSRALDMANYIKTEDVSNNENRKLVKKLGDCASYLVFKHYYTENKVILHGMKTCRQQLLCPFCALRRAAKHVKAYWDKVAVVKAENPELQLYFVTLTVRTVKASESGLITWLRLKDVTNKVGVMLSRGKNSLSTQRHKGRLFR